MMRFFYTSLFFLLLPFVLLRLYWRGFKQAAYRNRWQERLAFFSESYRPGSVWFHAVSVGEAEAAFPLIQRLQKQHPDTPFLVTTTTPTGSARVQAVLGDGVYHVYLPYDIPMILSRFFQIFKPSMLVVLEKEIWPNLFAQCGKNNIPLLIINARLSARSAKSYQLISSLVKPALANVNKILAQTEEDRAHFMDIGAEADKVEVSGNLKFDIEIPAALIEQGRELKRALFPARFVWIVASTHAGEEALFFAQYKRLKKHIPELLLLIVPRHPERFETVRQLAEQHALKVIKRTEKSLVDAETDIYLADTMGELKMLYAAADVAFVGGSMVAVGGHNILEPLAIGVPVMFGPQMFNFKEIAANVLQQQAAVQCSSASEVGEHLLTLYQNKQQRQQMMEQGFYFIRQNQGAVAKTSAVLQQYWPEKEG
jgi:3-deoxy-D-manno-octulosonic-acid transferase